MLQKKLKLLCTAALDIAFPRSCLLSGEPVHKGPYRYLGAVALSELTFVTAPWCRTCGMPLYGLASPKGQCDNCRALCPVFQEGRSVLCYKGAGKQIVHELKYNHGSYLLPDIARLVSEAPNMKQYLAGAQLVPVPLHPRKLKERGFNQSEVIVRALLKAGLGQGIAPVLERTRNTPSQTHLDREKRHNNVKNAFALKRESVISMGINYVIVDDVCTTGATLGACAEALAASGATHIKILTFAHG